MKTKKILSVFFAWTAVIVLILSVALSFSVQKTSQNTFSFPIKIAIDAGHGGLDGGSVGTLTGKDENYLNLQYALCLENILKEYNISTIMTRTNLNGLYDIFADNKKISDMEKRKEIVNNSKANILISIHMNSFPLSSCRGAQVFFKSGDEKSEQLANAIQSVFIKTLPNARQSVSIGDYYMLNEFSIPCVIVECGYLSNEEEEKLLVSDDYRKLVCGSIFVGIVKFLSM